MAESSIAERPARTVGGLEDRALNDIDFRQLVAAIESIIAIRGLKGQALRLFVHEAAMLASIRRRHIDPGQPWIATPKKW